MYNPIDLKIRIKELQGLINVKEKFKNNSIIEYNIQNGIETNIKEFHKPIIEENKNILIAIEKNKENNIENNKNLIKSIEDSKQIIHVKDQNTIANVTELYNYNFNPNFLINNNFPKQIEISPTKISVNDRPEELKILDQNIPIFKIGKSYYAVGEDKNDKKNYLGNIKENEFFGKRFELNQELNDLISGKYQSEALIKENHISLDSLKIYRNLINTSGVKSHVGNYFSSVTKLIKELEKKGKGLKYFIPKNPIEKFIELRKLISAKISGHNNVDNQIQFILNSLKKITK